MRFGHSSSKKVEGSGSCCPETIKLLMEPLAVGGGGAGCCADDKMFPIIRNRLFIEAH